MDFERSYQLKTYKGQGLSYFHLVQSLPCLDLISTPLNGDPKFDLSIADFGPLLLARKCNNGAAIEEARYGEHTLVFQLPIADMKAIELYQSLPGDGRHSPFQMPGAEVQWLIPENIELFQIQVDRRLVEQVLGRQALQDYQELCKVPSRKAYDAQVLFSAAAATEHAINIAFEYGQTEENISSALIANLLSDILLPCIM